MRGWWGQSVESTGVEEPGWRCGQGDFEEQLKIVAEKIFLYYNNFRVIIWQIQKGYDEMLAGKGRPADSVFADILGQ